jgi:hypothetical protein
MSVLFPRLLPGAVKELRDRLLSGALMPPAAGEPPDLSRTVFAATGGRRVTAQELQVLRRAIVDIAGRHGGFPDSRSRSGNDAFDVATARYLREHSGMTPGEASQRAVWSFLGLVLLPDVCAWRYPPKESRGFFDERFVATDLTRHTLAKLWIRAFLLCDPDAEDPYELLGVLGEADLDQLLSRRRDIAATPALVRAIVRVHRDDLGRDPGLDDAPARDLLRDSVKRLRRLSGFLDLDSRSSAELEDLVRRTREDSRRAMAGEVPVVHR